jgi:hypothetical protein
MSALNCLLNRRWDADAFQVHELEQWRKIA